MTFVKPCRDLCKERPQHGGKLCGTGALIGLKTLLNQGLSEPVFSGDLVYKLKKIVGSNDFSAQFIKIKKKDWL